MNDRQWIDISSNMIKNSHAEKQVISTDYEKQKASGKTVISYNLQGFWDMDAPYENPGTKLFDLPGGGYNTQAGAPMLITEGMFVAIPEYAKFSEIKILSFEEKDLDFEADILPVPKPALESEKLEFIKNEAIYSSDEQYPSKIVEYVDTVEVLGVKCVHLMIYPIKYRPKSKKATVITNLVFEIKYEADNKATDNILPSKRNYLRSSTKISSQILGLVENSTDQSVSARMLIITIPDFKDSLNNYISYKSNKFTSDIAMVQDIYNKYPSKSEVSAIHSYIMEEHRKSPLAYVLLAGDLANIPALEVTEGAVGTFKSDSYYSLLDGEFTPLFGLSRFPASNKDELVKMCRHAMNYDTQAAKAKKNVLLTTYKDYGYEQCKDAIYTSVGSAFNMVKCYDGKVSKEDLIDEINKGKTFINYRGHGDSSRWQSSNGLNTSDVGHLLETDCSPHVLSICCSNNDMRQLNCFGVAWIKKLKAVTFLGAAAPSYTVVNHDFDKYLWEAIHKMGLTTISDIYIWATITLFKNRKGDGLTKTNIKEYLLLGDPSSDYTEKVKSVGYAMMLDASGTMYDAQSLVKICSKAFVEYSLSGDQLGINMFNNSANWIYPQNSTPVTVSASLNETSIAADKIESIYNVPSYSPLTNMGASLKLSNSMYPNFKTDVKAFVMLSDGWYNTGDDPHNILSSNPPLFVTGIGPYFDEKYFTNLLKKNSKSRLYSNADKYYMMLMFNDIRSDIDYAPLLINDASEYKIGSNGIVRNFYLSSFENVYKLGVVWSNNKYKYSADYPGDGKINVIIYDPKNNRYNEKPIKDKAGYCIFDIKDAIPGKWTVVIQYSTREKMGGTIGGFDLNPPVTISSTSPCVTDISSPVKFQLSVKDNKGKAISDANVSAVITKPTISLDDLLKKYENELSQIELDDNLCKSISDEKYLQVLKLRQFSEQMLETDGFDISNPQKLYLPMKFDGCDTYSCVADAVDNNVEGVYTACYEIEGVNLETGFTYKYYKNHSMIVCHTFA